MPKAAIIIRTKNEERWIKPCLAMIEKQTHRDWEVILVDNQSTDATVAIARRFGVTKIVSIDSYLPGDALNRGIAEATGEYAVCLSAHCLPRDEHWLANLLTGFDRPSIAGVYGRQIPVAFSSASDKRDLLTTFGRDRRTQTKDYFFHNANSAIRLDIWRKTPFDAQATNIEDRLWAQIVLEQGYQINYEPEAVVYHHHGIHQNNEPARAKGVVSIIESVDAESASSLPAILKPDHCTVAAIVPVVGDIQTIGSTNLLHELLQDIAKSKYISSTHVVADATVPQLHIPEQQVSWITRPAHLNTTEVALPQVLQYALTQIEAQGIFPDVIVYLNYLFPFRPDTLLDTLVTDLQTQGRDTIFPGLMDYQNYWLESDGQFVQVGDGLKPRDAKQPLYRALYGLGTATRAEVIRRSALLGEKISILPLTDSSYTLKAGEKSMNELIAAKWQALAVKDKQPSTALSV